MDKIYIVMTDEPSRGGKPIRAFTTKEKAELHIQECLPWSESWFVLTMNLEK